MRSWPGKPYPLGATYDGAGTNFSVFSEIADRVDLCLFDESGLEQRIALPESTGFCWHGYFPGVEPGQRYGYRVHGPWRPTQGLWCDPSAFLMDPYAKAVEGQVGWDDALFPTPAQLDGTQPRGVDTARFMPRSIVVNPWFDWGSDRSPAVAWNDTVLYEAHVKGLTQRHPGVPGDLRGTYLGVAHPSVIEHLKSLNVTAIELLPVHQFVHDRRLVEMGLRNYWGYNSIAYLAPHNEYALGGARGQQVSEFKQMVKTLHSAGIEVILDVVYNHTAEGDHRGPILGLRGIDNPAYYRLDPTDPSSYVDYTGTGNSLNMRHPHVLQLIMDSLRYWVTEMHVDGFRFDLAAALARELHDVDRLSSFFDLIQQDPVVSRVKLIAEPWDVGEGGYQVGNFPPLWTEWNGKYRDTVRDFWRGGSASLGEVAARLAGSSDLYRSNGRSPFASINFVTCHDGFTLADLTAYESKHNESNGEANRDGSDDNRSWNCGVEGPTADPEIVDLRARQRRNMLATLMLSQGVPMLLGGDELGRTQDGNNNAYCQDNEVSWLDWESADDEFLAFARHLTSYRAAHPVLRRRGWLTGASETEAALPDAAWFTPSGTLMSEEDWHRSGLRLLTLYLNGEAITGANPIGERIRDDALLLVMSSAEEPVDLVLPPPQWAAAWVKDIDTAGHGAPEPRDPEFAHPYPAGAIVRVEARSMLVLRAAEAESAKVDGW